MLAPVLLRASARSAAPALLLAACSMLPPTGFPPYAEHDVVAEYVVPAAGRLSMPTSRPDLVVHELRAEPPPLGEAFGSAGERFWLFPPGAHVAVHCRCRAYADGRGHVPAAAELLPEAARLRAVDRP